MRVFILFTLILMGCSNCPEPMVPIESLKAKINPSQEQLEKIAGHFSETFEKIKATLER